MGTIKKSETYKISGAAERRAVPIRELVENKRQQLKKKSSRRSPHDPFAYSVFFLRIAHTNKRLETA
jgi:hypothetical protein